MSVKTMTTEAIRLDLKTIGLTWPDGVPYQQQDRVNALKGELKRRGEPIGGPVELPLTAGSLVDAMRAATTEELESQLRKLSTRDDEPSQKQFADIRYELRRRAKEDSEPIPPARSQVQPRELELPSDDEIVMKPSPTDGAAERSAIRRPTVPAPRAVAKAKQKPPETVRGFTATERVDGSVVLEFEVKLPTGSVLMAQVFEANEMSDFLTMGERALERALKHVAGG